MLYNLKNNNIKLQPLVNKYNLNLFKLLNENNLLSQYKQDLFNSACEKGELEMCKFFYSLNNINIRNNNEYCFIHACKYGHINICKWLLKIDPNINILDSTNYNNTLDAFYLACLNGHIEIINWLYKFDEIKKGIKDGRWNWAFCDCCKKNNLDILKFLYRNKIYRNENDISLGFLFSCRNGLLDICKWLYTLEEVNVHIYNEYVFTSTCKSGQLDVCKWLYENINYNIHVNNNEAFIQACLNNHIDICVWLLSISKFNINSRKYYVFKNSPLEIKKLLLTIEKINININNDEIFVNECLKNNLKEIKWLLQINDKIDINNIFFDDSYYSIYNNREFINILFNNNIDINKIKNKKFRDIIKTYYMDYIKKTYNEINNDMLFSISCFI